MQIPTRQLEDGSILAEPYAEMNEIKGPSGRRILASMFIAFTLIYGGTRFVGENLGVFLLAKEIETFLETTDLEKDSPEYKAKMEEYRKKAEEMTCEARKTNPDPLTTIRSMISFISGIDIECTEDGVRRTMQNSFPELYELLYEETPEGTEISVLFQGFVIRNDLSEVF